MGKKDLNFIRHVKPQVVEKAKSDKEQSRHIQYQNRCRDAGITPYLHESNLGDLVAVAAFLNHIKDEEECNEN